MNNKIEGLDQLAVLNQSQGTTRKSLTTVTESSARESAEDEPGVLLFVYGKVCSFPRIQIEARFFTIHMSLLTS